MRIGFYLANKGNVYDKLISAYTNSEFSHTELIFGDDITFSSSPIDKGTRFSNINKFDLSCWIIFELDITKLNLTETYIKAEAKKLNNYKYDWVGIFFSQFLKLNIENNQKWWCSEVVAYLLGLKNKNVSPSELFLELLKNNYIKRVI